MCSKCEKMRLKRESFYLCFYIFIKGAVIILLIMDAVLCLDVVRAHPCIAVDIRSPASSCSCALKSEISSFVIFWHRAGSIGLTERK